MSMWGEKGGGAVVEKRGVVPLLAVVCTFRTSRGALMARIS